MKKVNKPTAARHRQSFEGIRWNSGHYEADHFEDVVLDMVEIQRGSTQPEKKI